MSKLLITLGIILVVLGLLWPYLDKIGLGRLPGDFHIKGENFSFYFPLTTSIIISLLLSVILWLINR